MNLCLREIFLFLLSGANVSYKHACFTGDKRALNTFRLPAQTEWKSKGHTHTGICTQRCEDTHDTRKHNTRVFLLANLKNYVKVQTERVTSNRNCAVLRWLQTIRHMKHTG